MVPHSTSMALLPRSAATSDGEWGRRLALSVEHAAGRSLERVEKDELAAVSVCDPNALRGMAERILGGRVAVTGTVESRLLIAERHGGFGEWTIADLSGQPLARRRWPGWTMGRVTIDNPDGWLSTGTVTPEGVVRLTRPRVLLCSLYHPEWFPLPRLALSISDVARAARKTLMGQVQLVDMQLGVSFENLVAEIGRSGADIVGVSATFGQHDLLIRLLDHLCASSDPPMVLAGGSLVARNQGLLHTRYPDLLIARGAGEPTIAGVLGYFHGDLSREAIPGLSTGGNHVLVVGPPSVLRTPIVPNARQDDFLPELDLLDATLKCHGVAQLEASRGCTSACSFCPRSHKGKWAPGTSHQLGTLLPEISQVFERHPDVTRTLYLVDEECIGRGPDAVPRVLELAKTIHDADFGWESSCRIDQVVRPDEDREWHIERARMWRELVRRGLRRMLFGVESGVTSILARFNKETTGDQNVLAIRTLSALGVPTRFTYITFDQLMTREELTATHAFQGRTDLILAPQPHLAVEEIVDGVRDPEWVAAHSTGRPFYSGISYMLVSMECLIGAAYTRMATDQGMTGAADPSMGRVEARFADERIGVCARSGQLWVDRNFALDYTLKSLEKLVDGARREKLHAARVTIRTAAYRVLTGMLALIKATPSLQRMEDELTHLLDAELALLRDALAELIIVALPMLPTDSAAVLHAEHRRWLATTEWKLINTAEACGT